MIVINWLFWITGGFFWAFVLYQITFVLGAPVVFAYRMGWRNAKDFTFGQWVRWALYPPDAVGGWYWPSEGGREMKARHEAQLARWEREEKEEPRA